MESLKIVFWACLVLVFYTYLGYGILLFLLLKLKQLFCKKEQKAVLPADESQFPDVTLMICAFNEEEIIKDKSFEDILMKILEAIKNIKEENKEI